MHRCWPFSAPRVAAHSLCQHCMKTQIPAPKGQAPGKANSHMVLHTITTLISAAKACEVVAVAGLRQWITRKKKGWQKSGCGAQNGGYFRTKKPSGAAVSQDCKELARESRKKE